MEYIPSNPHTPPSTRPNNHPILNLQPSPLQGNTVLLTDEYVKSIPCPHPKRMEISKLDSSLALGFYC